MKKGLISIITPCFNTGLYVNRLLDSVLKQNYKNVEMFVVDDGSTDNTKQIISDYKHKFFSKGYSLHYIYQDNSGQSVAINKALKLVNGEFLLWPDSDDFYVDTGLFTQMVSVLSTKDDNITMVRCLPTFVDEENLPSNNKIKNKLFKTELFEDCLYGKNNFWFPPICYMAKMSSIDFLIPGREIFVDKNAGQNWQIMLPLLYEKKCVTIINYGVHILERKNSHSRGFFSGYDREIQKLCVYEETILSTLSRMNDIDYSTMCFYQSEIKSQYLRKKLLVAFKYKKNDDFNSIFNEIPEDRISLLDKLMKLLIHFPCGYIMYRLLSKFLM